MCLFLPDTLLKLLPILHGKCKHVGRECDRNMEAVVTALNFSIKYGCFSNVMYFS